MTKVAFVTDVRYWHRKTGAQQRIYALAKYFRQQVDEVVTLFAAPISQSPRDADRDLIAAAGIEVVSLIDDWNPIGLAGNLRWRASCIRNALRPRLRNSDFGNTKELVDFESKLLKERFGAFVQMIKPDVVIVEYLTLSYLVPPVGDREGVLYAVDTHDLLSSRCEQFRNRGHRHWVEISEEEDARPWPNLTS